MRCKNHATPLGAIDACKVCVALECQHEAFAEAAEMVEQALAEWTATPGETVLEFGYALHTKLEAQAKGGDA